MLDLYSASAGSGKTYTLAKKYIFYFITITDDEGHTRLRTLPELIDSARHILAVTFTNKATNEMQMRIVDSLYNLAHKQPEYKINKKGRKVIVKPDYMQDFIDELGLSIPEIQKISASALEVLLENYSDFNVSTIDSFFQQVLRTFAYESEINDSYQVEIDSGYLSQVGVDLTLDEIDNNEDDLHTRYWIQKLMDQTEKGRWNIFSRPESSGKNTENPYKTFIDSVKKMETEEYKLKRGQIEEYFDSLNDTHNFKTLFEDLSAICEKPVRDAFQKVMSAFRSFYDWLLTVDLSTETGDRGRFFKVSKRVIEDNALEWNRYPAIAGIDMFEIDYLQKKKVTEWTNRNPEGTVQLTRLFTEVVKALVDWKSALQSEEYQHWLLYSKNLPFFALFGIVSRKRREYLEETNAIELAETSMILRGVIKGSDAPFVYERIGNRLNHFLIDEFQDTSRMQWDNLSPLVDESMARGNGNLIIGDAKQSIYRFRNADPELITKDVPNKYRGSLSLKGNNPSENTNYRSLLNVVKFNNSFFRYLADGIDRLTDDPTGSRKKFASLYGNVVQTPSKTEDEGYVEINLFSESKTGAETLIVAQIPKLIDSLLRRGFRQNEICVLVDVNNQATVISNAIIQYNSELPEGSQKIEFVSEQSLKVASSQAVNIITGVLANMARGTNPEIRQGEERRKYGPATADELKANFKFFSLQHNGKSRQELLDMFLDGEPDFDVLSDLLANMQSLAIPALVEAVTAKFVSPELAREEALYIAAFQDLVLEYCESHPTDIGSFLKWWERKSRTAAVSSPEDTNAVQIMTIHKAKGLEREVAIVPFASWDMCDTLPYKGFSEWRWVVPNLKNIPSTLALPPYLPVEISELMASTSHKDMLERYYDESKMDRINKAYVAFTRAKRELYVYASAHGTFNAVKKDTKKAESDPQEAPEIRISTADQIAKPIIGNFIYDFITSVQAEPSDTHRDIALLGPELIEVSDDMLTITIGQKPEKADFEREERQAPLPVDNYRSTAIPQFLKIKEASLPPQNHDEEEEDLDPRSEGNIKHAVLERVRTVDELPRAVNHLKMSGVIPYGMADSIEQSLAEALQNPQALRWFEPGLKIINERPLLRNDEISRRPDRLVVFPDGHVEIVDYKFGKIKKAKYRNQISHYASLLRQTGKYTDVKGFLWYVNENEIDQVV